MYVLLFLLVPIRNCLKMIPCSVSHRPTRGKKLVMNLTYSLGYQECSNLSQLWHVMRRPRIEVYIQVRRRVVQSSSRQSDSHHVYNLFSDFPRRLTATLAVSKPLGSARRPKVTWVHRTEHVAYGIYTLVRGIQAYISLIEAEQKLL